MKKPRTPPIVAIVMGSKSDLPSLAPATKILKKHRIAFEIAIKSAHRTPHEVAEFAEKAHLRGIRLIIAGAGGAAHLPGMVAAYTPLPVIGVPVRSRVLQGADSLLSILQMPKGIPVATVPVGDAHAAALLAVRILGKP